MSIKKEVLVKKELCESCESELNATNQEHRCQVSGKLGCDKCMVKCTTFKSVIFYVTPDQFPAATTKNIV